jgi:hypothetical protein
MRSKLTLTSPAAALARILDRLDRELIDASDEDIMEAARDLGMNPMMKGSAAFLGLQAFSLAEFAAVHPLVSEREARRLKPGRSIERKGPATN